MTNIALIGCTGNIGKQVCDVVRRYPDKFRFSTLVCNSDEAALSVLKEEFQPDIAFCAETEKGGIDVFEGCDVAFIAVSGFAGLSYTLRAARQGKKIALANKESLVCGGELVMKEIEAHGAELIPVDSEHSAIFQALGFRRRAPFKKLILTASGGPFLHYGEEALARVTPEEALRHPKWNMGAKITVDSATLLNKGYEVIEAKWLYGADFSQIEVVVHPESVVHSLVSFADGATLAQLGYPDMRLPIQLALTYPHRLPCAPEIDLVRLGALHFERVPEEKFPCFSLALRAGKEGGTSPTILNGAAEVAVKAFLDGSIPFPKIAETILCALERIPREKCDGFGALEEADKKARICANQFIYGK